MSGPNSAPNGDARLVKGYPGEEFIWNENKKIWESLRDVMARKGRLDTGKTGC